MSKFGKIKRIERTCLACPSQWEGKLTDGRMFYVRYRWGYLSIRVSNGKTDDSMNAVRGEEIFGAQLGSDMDGCLSEQHLMEIVKTNDLFEVGG